jgi:2-amino-4-hydroxy-6-hydroxymethyldihydropteridine diphosphokinase
LGGNVGDRLEYLRRGVDLLRCEAGNLTAISAVYESEPWGFNHPCWFLNQVVAVETELDAFALLKSIQQIEQTLGRLRIHHGYQARTMDIDILLYSNRIINTPELIVPHPRMAERMFVLLPMAELAPDLEHPVMHRSMANLREHCTDTMQVRVLNSKK